MSYVMWHYFSSKQVIIFFGISNFAASLKSIDGIAWFKMSTLLNVNLSERGFKNKTHLLMFL